MKKTTTWRSRPMLAAVLSTAIAAPACALVIQDGAANGINPSVAYSETSGGVAVPVSPGAPMPVVAYTTNNVSAISTLTPPNYTVGYSYGQLIASSATAASVVVPYFSVLSTTVDPVRVRLSVADGSAGWNNALVQVDLWESAPTFNNGDGGTWSLATGSAHHVGSFSVQLSTFGGDGSAGEGALNANGLGIVSLNPGGKVYWTLKYIGINPTGTINASHAFTLRPEVHQ